MARVHCTLCWFIDFYILSNNYKYSTYTQYIAFYFIYIVNSLFFFICIGAIVAAAVAASCCSMQMYVRLSLPEPRAGKFNSLLRSFHLHFQPTLVRVPHLSENIWTVFVVIGARCVNQRNLLEFAYVVSRRRQNHTKLTSIVVHYRYIKYYFKFYILSN